MNTPLQRPKLRLSLRCLCIGLCLLCPLSLAAQGGEVDAQTRQRERLQEEIKTIDQQISQTRKGLESNTKLLDLTRRKISNRNQLIADLDSRVASLDRRMQAQSARILELEQQQEEMLAAYESLLCRFYLNRHKESWLLYVLASSDLRQAYRRWRYFKDYAAHLNLRLERIRATERDLVEAQEELARSREESLQTRSAREAEVKTLHQEESGAQKLIASMQRNEKALKAQLEAKKKEVERLNREIERLIAAAMAQQQKEAQASGNQAAYASLAADFAQNKGRLPQPVQGAVLVESFGQHAHPVFKNVQLPFNNGITLSAPAGAQVRAVFQGVVKQVVTIPGYRLCVLLQHGNYYTFYCKLGTVAVKAGQQVAAGGVLGTLPTEEANAGFHFELWQGNVKQNPALWLAR